MAKSKTAVDHGPMGYVLFMAWIGALVYFIGRVDGFWNIIIAFFKPAYGQRICCTTSCRRSEFRKAMPDQPAQSAVYNRERSPERELVKGEIKPTFGALNVIEAVRGLAIGVVYIGAVALGYRRKNSSD